MIDGARTAGGAPIIRKDTALPTRFDDLAGFERCLEPAQGHFGMTESLCAAPGV